jgi:hypothetical protein
MFFWAKSYDKTVKFETFINQKIRKNNKLGITPPAKSKKKEQIHLSGH